MKRGINLKLPKKKTSQAVKKAYTIAIGLFLFTFAVGILLVGVNLFLEARIKGLGDEENDLKSQIFSQNAKHFKLHDTHERLASIKKIIDGRSSISDEVEKVASILPEDIALSEIEADGKSVAFTITTEDLSKINTLLEEKLVELANEQGKGVRRIEMKSLSLDAEDRVYDLDFEVSF